MSVFAGTYIGEYLDTLKTPVALELSLDFTIPAEVPKFPIGSPTMVAPEQELSTSRPEPLVRKAVLPIEMAHLRERVATLDLAHAAIEDHRMAVGQPKETMLIDLAVTATQVGTCLESYAMTYGDRGFLNSASLAYSVADRVSQGDLTPTDEIIMDVQDTIFDAQEKLLHQLTAIHGYELEPDENEVA